MKEDKRFGERKMKQLQQSKVKILFFYSICIFLLFLVFVAKAEIVTLAWQAQLDVLAGMENELPPGVSPGQSITGSFTYDTTWKPASRTNDWSVCNYDVMSWQMNLGNNVYSRYYGDGYWVLGQGMVQIRNNNTPIFNDYFDFGSSISPRGGNINDFLFSLVLQDNDLNVWNSATLPANIPLSEFEIIVLSIYKIKLDAYGSKVMIANYTGMDEFLLRQIPEPGTMGLLAVGAMALLRKRRA